MRFDEKEWQRLEDALRDPEPWALADELALPPPDPQSLRELAWKIEEERAVAREQLEPLLQSPQRFEAASVDGDPEFLSSGVVEVLTSAAEALHEQRPQFALVLADTAISIATKLAGVDELRSPSLLGYARLERAKVLFIIGRYRECEEELRLADVAFRSDEYATDWDHARVALVRANACVETHRLDEAIEEANEAASVFEVFGDTARYLAARMIEGNVLFMRRDYTAAAHVLDALAAEARDAGDKMHLALSSQSAGNCYIELGELSTAEARLVQALALWNELGVPVERVRTNWSLGVLARARGDFDLAITRITEAYRAFDALGIINDAAIARLELAELLLLADRTAEVPDVLRGVVVSFAGEGMMRNANIALAYLREAVESESIEQRLIRHVREYLEELPSHPGAEFSALA